MSFECMAWAVKQKLPATQKIVLLMLADRTNGDTGRCNPSMARLADDCGMSVRSVRNAIRLLEEAGLITTQQRVIEGVFVPNHYILNIHNYVPVRHEVPGGTAADAEGVRQELPINQELEPGSKPSGRGKPPPCPHQEIVDLYHEHCPTLPRVKVWTDARRKSLQARWREDKKRQDLTYWAEFFQYVDSVPFLRGDKTFQADLEWLVTARNFVKVIEGKYEDREAA